MKIAIFSTKSYDKEYLNKANKDFGHELMFLEAHLNIVTVSLANGYDAVCVFVNDELNKDVIIELAKYGIKLIALRCAGFNNVDLLQAKESGIQVVRVPSYSPHGVSEHAVALILALDRRICRAYNRVRDGNFSIEGLLGFELFGKTVGVMGTGRIGMIFAGIMQGFGCKVLAYDLYQNPKCMELGIQYVSKEEIFAQSDIISLHLPLTRDTHHIINEEALANLRNIAQTTLKNINGLKNGKMEQANLVVVN